MPGFAKTLSVPKYKNAIFSIGSSNSSVPAPVFYAPLNGSLAPTIGTGTYTFSRTSVATMRDFEGYVRNCVSGEARFYNARRVENLLRNANAKSNAINDGVWAKWAGTETINGPNQYTETVGTSAVGIYTPPLFTGDVNGRIFVVSFSAYKVSGTNATWQVLMHNQADAAVTNVVTLTMTGSLQRFSCTLTGNASSTSAYLRIRSGVAEAGRSLHIEQIMVEEVTSQTNQNPSEHVTFGMGDNQGCGVDGIKWFPYRNGNTVASNVVTDNTGSTIGNTLYLSEQEKTNLVWPSENLADAQWTKNNIVAAQLTTYIGGSVLLNSVKASSTSDVIHSSQQFVTTLVADGDIAVAMFVAAGTQAHAFIRISKGAESAAQFFNASTGVVESAISSGGTISVNSGTAQAHAVLGGYWFHCIINGASVAGQHAVEFGISNADGVVNYAAANTTDVLCSMSGMQAQLDHEIGEYIRTTVSSVTKAGDNLSYNVANITSTEFAMTAECEIETPCASLCNIINVSDVTATAEYYIGGRNTDRFEAGQINMNGDSVYRARSGTISVGHHKGGASLSRHIGQRIAAVNGILVNSNPIDLEDSTSWSASTFTVACRASGTGQPDFGISHVKIFPRLTSAQLQAATA